MLLMTTLISWFLVLMQFLWKYMEDLVGKGLSIGIITQAIFYSSMSLLPLALSLGVLFASIMYFGNMGERLELLAMKSAGIPLYRIMRPLMITILSLAVGLFVFQNTYMITSQVRMWTIILSAREASPELEIPESTFYNGIPGYNIYVKQRDKANPGRLHDILIYDYKSGTEGARIIRADSGRIVMDKSKTFLTWRLYHGESFENLSQPSYSLDDTPTSYARERFAYKEILISFDANFHQADESDMRRRFVGKNLHELNIAIDSATHYIDSIRQESSLGILNTHFRERYSYQMPSVLDTSKWAHDQRVALLGNHEQLPIKLDSLIKLSSLTDSLAVVERAIQKVEALRMDIELRKDLDSDAFYEFRTNRQEWHRKFTFPAACIVFFFIGAPLGAIIRKGGLGMPLIASVLFFITYYIIDTFGHNMILSRKMSIELGMWLSTLVLLPIGIFLTYQASRDSAKLNIDTYVLFFQKLFGINRVRKIEYKEVVFTQIDIPQAVGIIDNLRGQISEICSSPNSQSLWTWYSHYNVDKQLANIQLGIEELITELSNIQRPLVLAKLADLPYLPQRLSWLVPSPAISKAIIIGAYIFFPIGWMLSKRRKAIVSMLTSSSRTLSELKELLEQ